MRARIAWWVGDFDTQERVAEEALEIARRLERKDLEAQALNDLAQAYRHQQRLDEAEELLAPGARARGARAAASSRARRRCTRSACVKLDRSEAVEGERLLEEARALFAEVGGHWMLGRTLNELARAAEQQDDYATAERLLREAIRLLKPLEDRGALCESQRAARRGADPRGTTSTRPSGSRWRRSARSASTTSAHGRPRR